MATIETPSKAADTGSSGSSEEGKSIKSERRRRSSNADTVSSGSSEKGKSTKSKRRRRSSNADTGSSVSSEKSTSIKLKRLRRSSKDSAALAIPADNVSAVTASSDQRDISSAEAPAESGKAPDAQAEQKSLALPAEPKAETAIRSCTNRFIISSIAFAMLGVLMFIFMLILILNNRHLPEEPKKKRPHIIFILADDMGWGDVGYHGNPEVRTPNMDVLAWNGVRFSRLYYQPLCSPTRSAIMTGRYPINTGLQHFVILNAEPRGLPLDLKILPQWLNDLGYTSYIFGKWHLGFYKSEYTPTKRGFVSHVGNWGGGVDYYSHRVPAFHKLTDYGLDFRRNLTVANSDTGKYYTEIVTAESVSVIKNHPVDKPLFLYVAHESPHYSVPHDPLQVPDRHYEPYAYMIHKNRSRYAALMSSLDESVGIIFAALQDRGMLDDTVFIFSSDNGASSTAYQLYAASNWPLRGEKITLWEGGVRVPGFLWTSKPLWKGAGSDYDNYFHATDWLPTLFELAGGDLSKLPSMDGVSHFSCLHKPSEHAPPRNEVVVNIDPTDNNAAIIDGRHKLILGKFPYGSSDWIKVPGTGEPSKKENEISHQSCLKSPAYKVLLSRGAHPRCGVGDDVYSVPVNCGKKDSTKKPCDAVTGPCLYDIILDPCEYNDIASEHPEVVKRLQDRIEALKKKSTEPRNLPPDPEAYPSRHGGVWVSWKDAVPS